MEYIVTKTIDKSELKEYKDYVGFLFLNKDGVYNICKTEEDVMKSNQWFENLPLNTIVVSDDKVDVGDSFLAISTNQNLNGRLFKFKAHKEVDLVVLEDKDGNEVTSTKFILDGAYKFIRLANQADKEKVVNGIITPIRK
jgi:hypothetical protein